MENKQRELANKLNKIIVELLGKDEWLLVSSDKLHESFFENLKEMMDLAFDLNISVDKLKKFIDKHGSKPKIEELGGFLVETMDSEKSHILLNYYYYKFTQVVLRVVKEEKLNDVEMVFERNGVKEEEIKKIKVDYKALVQK